MLNLNFSPFPVLSTPRLTLRRIERSDVNEIFFLRSDERVMRYIDRPRAKTTDEAGEFIEMIQNLEHNNESILWAITLNGAPELIGTICIWNIRKEHHRGELGYVLHPDHHRKGLMQEALAEVIRYGFDTIKLHSLEANVNPENKASITLLERAGFVREAYFRENYYFDGKYLDSAIYSLLSK